MKRLLLSLIVAAACAKPSSPTAPAPKTAAADPDAAERVSLLDMAHGATVVSRTGEMMLELSALRAVDGDPGSFWMNPPHDLPQSMTVALPARSRIEKVGIRTFDKGGFTAGHVSFEASDDGKRFTPLATITSADSKEPQWLAIKPLDASYVRVTMVDPMVPDHDVRLSSVLAAGKEIEPPHPGEISGCWSVNGRATRFARDGARVVGIMQMGNEPIRFDGGFDGRIFRLNWIRGNDYGLALLTVAPGGHELSGMQWHEEAIPLFFADSWFGQKTDCADTATLTGSLEPLLHRVGRFPLFAIRFRRNGSLDATASRAMLQALANFLRSSHGNVRFVAHEFRQPDAAANRDFAQREIDALRAELRSSGANLDGVDFVAQGSDSPRQEPVTESMRTLYSSVDLEIRR